MKNSIAMRPAALGTPLRPLFTVVPAPMRDEAAALLRAELIGRLKAKLVGYGWRSCAGDAAAEAACFTHLLPAPDATFTVANPSNDEHGVVALHFAESENAVWYACTMRLPDGKTAQEHGLLDVATGAMRVVTSHGEMICQVKEA